MPGKLSFPGILPFSGIFYFFSAFSSPVLLRLSYGSEELHLLLYGILDGLEARSQKLTRIKALALLILALFNILTGSSCEGKLALGIHIDLGNAQGNGLLDHVCRNACAAVEHQRKVSGLLLYGIQGLKA